MRLTIRTISQTTLTPANNQVAADWKLPTSLEWAPAGRSLINATKGNSAWTGIVITEPRDADRLNTHLQQLLAEAKTGARSRPYVDFDHDGGQAAAIPLRFYWENGIRLEVEWTSAGRDALAGRTYSYFSPEFLLGDDDHPESLPVPGSIGSLVNTPAFQRIERLAAANQKPTTHMPKLIDSLVAAGLVPDGVTGAAKDRTENAALKAKLGEMERREKEAEEKRKEEIEAEVDEAIKAGRCDPETRDIVVQAIMVDGEKGRKLIIRAERKSAAVRGEKPVTASIGHGNVTEEEDRIRAEDNPEKRRVMRADWYTRHQTRHLKAANTIDPALIVPIAQEAVITKLGAALAPLNAFCMVFSAAPMSPKVKQIIPLASADKTQVLRNATNFNQTFSTLDDIQVTPVQLTMPWNLTNANIQDGLRMTMLAEANIIALAEVIMTDLIATIDAVNFPGTQVTDKISEWSTKGVRKAFAVIANGRVRNLIVAPEIFAEIMHVDSKSFVLTPAQQGAGAYGFSGIWFHNIWARATSPVAGLKGFVCDPQAIAGVLGVPILAPGAEAAGLISSTATAPGAGATVQFNTWFSLDSRTPQMSYDVIFGSTVGDPTAGHLVIPAAETLLVAAESEEAEAAAATKTKK
jgi:hypothetical protein